MAEPMRALPTRWREFKVDYDGYVRLLRCKERFGKYKTWQKSKVKNKKKIKKNGTNRLD